MRLEHPIFKGPLTAEIPTHEIATPAEYHDAQDAPRLVAWTVQDGTLGDTVDYGLVSGPFGFEDSPDAEWISGGSNSKYARAVALGRHGNWFLWGFAGDPTQMTPAARAVFLNAVAWMDRFDGHGPLVAMSSGTAKYLARDGVVATCGFIGEEPDGTGAEYYLTQFPRRVIKEVGLHGPKLARYYQERLEYLRADLVRARLGSSEIDACHLDADATLEARGVGNRSPAFLALVQNLLAHGGADGATAAELVARYLPADAPREAAPFAAWVAERRERMYFSDRYGYRWFVAPTDLPPRALAPR